LERPARPPQCPGQRGRADHEEHLTTWTNQRAAHGWPPHLIGMGYREVIDTRLSNLLAVLYAEIGERHTIKRRIHRARQAHAALSAQLTRYLDTRG
jgi:hypothetical protein